MIIGRLGYNSANDRYGLLVSDLWEYDGFHCGEVLEVMVDDKWQKNRMEMGLDRLYIFAIIFASYILALTYSKSP